MIGKVSFNQNIYSNNGLNSNLKNGTVNSTTQPTTRSSERSPQTDVVSLSNKKPMSTSSKVLITMGGVATAVLGAVLAVKGYKSHRMAKALEQIEQRFVNLKENIPEVQKTFRDVFLRSDISEKETIEMLDRYKDVEKLRITGTKEEYLQAVFKEAKRNFGFEDCELIRLEKLPEERYKLDVRGDASLLRGEVRIAPKVKLRDIQNTMHHEMRHIKQHYFELNYDPKTFLHFKEALKTAKENHLGEKAAEEVFDSCIEDIQSVFNLKSISRDNIPPKLREYAKKCLDGQQNYVPLDVNYDLYYNNFVEVDARFAGESMAKLFGLMDK